MATLGGHVTVEDFANVSAGSGVHQFCRVGRHAFIGGYSVVTKDALPFARTVGSRPARIYGVNTIGLVRRGFPPDVIDEAEALVPLPAAVEAEHHAGAAADRTGSIAGVRGGAVPRRLHPHLAARRHPQAPYPPGGGSPGRRVSLHAARSDRRKRPLPVPRARRRAGRRPRRHDHRHQGRGVPRARGGGRAPAGGRAALDLARAAREVHQPAQERRRDAGRDGGPGQAHASSSRHRARPDTARRAVEGSGPATPTV